MKGVVPGSGVAAHIAGVTSPSLSFFGETTNIYFLPVGALQKYENKLKIVRTKVSEVLMQWKCLQSLAVESPLQAH